MNKESPPAVAEHADRGNAPLEGKIALVTGASRGIGAALARELAAQGAHVIALARTIGALEELDDLVSDAGGSATLVPLDLENFSAIDKLGPHLYERFGRLDVFVANAGILGVLSPLLHQDAAAWEKVININLTANFRLIRTLDPLLQRSEAGRAAFVTSGVTNSCPAYWGPYAVSKAGLEALAQTYAAECAETNVRVNLFDPGRVRTAMRAKAYPGEDRDKLALPEHVARKVIPLCLPDFLENGRRFAA